MNNGKFVLLSAIVLLGACNAPEPVDNGASSSSEDSAAATLSAVSPSSDEVAAQSADRVATTAPAASYSPIPNNNGEASMLRTTYGQCLEAASGVTPDIQDCIEQEFEYQDSRLSKAYQMLLSMLSGDKKAELEMEQKEWLSMRDAECGFDSEEGGQGQRLEANDCFLEMTAKRATELEAR